MSLTLPSLRRIQKQLDKAGAGSGFTMLTKKTLTYGEVETLALDLGLQWEYLLEKEITMLDMPPYAIRKYKNGHYGFDLEQLDDQEILVPIRNGRALITCPFENKDRMAPELLFVMDVPAVCSPKVALYSLKGLCVELLGIEHNLNGILKSKLYYLLERCCRPAPEERSFIFI
tara:strand:+ start:24773 stop:25291 length:519 start_codon:yes stop_codon:yes gene_type:complete